MAPSSQPPVGCVSVWVPISSALPLARERPKTVPMPSILASSPASFSFCANHRREAISIGESDCRTTPLPQAPNWRNSRKSLNSRSGLMLGISGPVPLAWWRRDSLPRGVAAIDEKVGSGHEGGFIAGEEKGSGCDLLRPTEPPQGVPGTAPIAFRRRQITEFPRHRLGGDTTRGERVHPDAVRRMIERHALGQHQERAFGDAVSGIAGLGDLAHLRGDVNDAAAAGSLDLRNGMPRHLIGAADIDRERTLPFGFVKLDDS